MNIIIFDSLFNRTLLMSYIKHRETDVNVFIIIEAGGRDDNNKLISRPEAEILTCTLISVSRCLRLLNIAKHRSHSGMQLSSNDHVLSDQLQLQSCTTVKRNISTAYYNPYMG